jgi:dephospho-CoA kinase
VLKARKQLEMQIYQKLNMKKVIIDNSQYDISKCKSELTKIINQHLQY